MDKYVCMMCGHVYDPAVGESKAFTTILCNSTEMDQYQCKIMSAAPIKAGPTLQPSPQTGSAPPAATRSRYHRKVVPDTLTAMRTISY